MLKWTVTKRNDNVVGSLSSLQTYDTENVSSRRSLGAVHRPIRNRQLRESRRKTLATTELHKRCLNRDKENKIVATPHPYTSTRLPNSSTPFAKHEFALRDVGNITPNLTPTSSTIITPNRKRNLSLSPVDQKPIPPKPEYASTLPTFDVEYSPCGIKAVPMIALRGLTIKDSYFKNPCYFRDEIPASKRLKFSPEVTPLSKRLSELRFSKMSFKRSENNNVNTSMDSSKELNDTELERIIDEILESSRKPNVLSPRQQSPINRRFTDDDTEITYRPVRDPAADLNVFCDNFEISPNKAGERTIIVDDLQTVNEREVRTPDPLVKQNEMKSRIIPEAAANGQEMSCHLRRQRGVRRKCKMEPEKRSAADRILYRKRSSLCYRSNDTTDSPYTPLDLFKSHSFLRKSIDHLACMMTPKDVGTESGISTINKNNGSKTSYESTPGIKAYDLQASSTPAGGGAAQQGIRRCLTFSESPESVEDSLDKRKSVASSTTSRCSKSSTIISGSLDLAIAADEQNIQIHVIRCNDLYRSNGSSVNAYVKVSIISTESTNESNSFQRTAVYKNSIRPFFDHKFVFERSDNDLTNRIQLAVWHRDRECKRSEFLGCMSFSINNLIAKEINGSYKLQPQSCLTTPTDPILVSELIQTSIDEATGIEEGVDYLPDQSLLGTTTVQMPKFPHQKTVADDPLFQRFIDDGKSNNEPIHQPTAKLGQTPLTITKQLIQNDASGYGFSIIWTHPPRIEKVEPGLSADIAGLLPGDFVIFVDIHNIVTMPEQNVLELIRQQNGQLNLEIYRQPGLRPSNDLKNYLARLAINAGFVAQPLLLDTRSSLKCCSNASFSVESSQKKRNPKVAFSEDVGQGVIV